MLVLSEKINNLEKNDNVILIGTLINKKVYEKYTDLIIDDNSSVFSVRSFEDFSDLDIGDNLLILAYINEYQDNKRFNLRKLRKINESEFLFWKIKLFKYNNFRKKIKEDVISDFNVEKESEEENKERNKNEKKKIENILNENIEPLEEELIENLEEIDEINIENIEDIKGIKEDIIKEKNVENNNEKDPKILIMAILENNPEEAFSFEELSRITGLDELEIEKVVEELYEEGEVFMPKPNYIKKL